MIKRSTRRSIACLGSMLFFLGLVACGTKESNPPELSARTGLDASQVTTDHDAAGAQKKARHIYDFTLDDIDGTPVSLDRYRGKVLLMVNTASRCGYTPQYRHLQVLYEQYRDQGFEVLAFPSRDFGGQEYSSNKDIANFCYTRYSVEFPLFARISIRGENKHPLYKHLTEESSFPGEVKWNFQKYLVARDGTILARYRPSLVPLSEEIMSDIETALAAT